MKVFKKPLQQKYQTVSIVFVDNKVTQRRKKYKWKSATML